MVRDICDKAFSEEFDKMIVQCNRCLAISPVNEVYKVGSICKLCWRFEGTNGAPCGGTFQVYVQATLEEDE